MQTQRVAPGRTETARSKEGAVAALEVCRRHDAPVLGRGAGSSLAGQTVNAAVVFDFSKYMNRRTGTPPPVASPGPKEGNSFHRLERDSGGLFPMPSSVVAYMLQHPKEWRVHRVGGCPGDGINGFPVVEALTRG